MNQYDFENALQHLLSHSLKTSTFDEVKPVAEALLYSDLLPQLNFAFKNIEKQRLVYLLEKFRRYSCSSVERRQQLKDFSTQLNPIFPLNHSVLGVDPLAQKLGLNEDLNHLKSQLLSL